MRHPPHSQHGAALIVALLILVILTMLGISALDSTKMETRMVHNMSEYNYAFQAAEMGLAQPRTYTRNNQLATITKQKTPLKGEIEMSRDGESGEKFSVKFITAEVQQTFRDTINQSGHTSASVKHYVIESTGVSSVSNSGFAPTVTLRGGISHIVPADPNLTSSIQNLPPIN